jgi:CheY-like chemotaxis protein
MEPRIDSYNACPDNIDGIVKTVFSTNGSADELWEMLSTHVGIDREKLTCKKCFEAACKAMENLPENLLEEKKMKKSLRVLVADVDGDSRAMCSEMLLSLGHTVTLAETHNFAELFLSEDGYDLLIANYDLGQEERNRKFGVDLINALIIDEDLCKNKGTHYILTCTADELGEAKRCMGEDGLFLQKPFQLSELRNMVARATQNKP